MSETIQCQDDVGGGIVLDKASPANFSLVLPNLPPDISIADTQELIINIYGTVIPGVSLDVLEMYWVLGKTHMDSGGITWEPFTCEYIVDESLLNWRTLHKWMMYINNNKDRRGRPPKDYTIDATLRVIDNFQNELFRLFFVNLWVSSVGEVRFSTREGQSNLESTAQFTYDRYELRDSRCEV